MIRRKRALTRPGRVRGLGGEPLEPRHLLAGTAVLDWNLVALEAARHDYDLGTTPEQAGPGGSSRALAIAHIAMYDAAVAIDRHYMPYFFDYHAAPGTSMDAAVSQAAHDTLAALFPRQKAMFNTALSESLAGIPQAARDAGVALGKKVAANLLAARAGDGAVANMSFTPGTQPGQWRPDPLHPDQIAWGPDWGDVAPFVITSAAAFAVPPVPAMTSQEYTDAFNEVKTLGGDGVTTTTTRTADQTEIGIFWGYDGTPGLGTPPIIYNQAARVIAQQRGNSEIDNARLFAMVNVAMADAGIASWDTKYLENFWRPITAIREADAGTGPTGLGDGNPNTVGDPNWTPLGAPNNNGGGTNFTPPFPAYTSGHATFGAAAFAAIREFYGTDTIAFTMGSDEFNGVTRDQHGQVRPVRTRSYDNLTEAIEENGISRIYLGIHWRFDMERGIEQGTAIAEYVARKLAKEVPTQRLLMGSHMSTQIGATALAAPHTAPAAVDEAIGGNDLDLTAEALATPLTAIDDRPAAPQSSAAPPGDSLHAVAFAAALAALDDETRDSQAALVGSTLAARAR